MYRSSVESFLISDSSRTMELIAINKSRSAASIHGRTSQEDPLGRRDSLPSRAQLAAAASPFFSLDEARGNVRPSCLIFSLIPSQAPNYSSSRHFYISVYVEDTILIYRPHRWNHLYRLFQFNEEISAGPYFVFQVLSYTYIAGGYCRLQDEAYRQNHCGFFSCTDLFATKIPRSSS